MIRNARIQILVLSLSAVMLVCLIPDMDLPAENMNYIAVNSVITTNYDITDVITDGNYDITASGNVYGVTGDVTGSITIAENVSTVLVLDGTVRVSDTSPLQLKAGSTVTLILADGTTNAFTCNSLSTAHSAIGAGIHVPPTATLIIKGQQDNSGELIAIGGTYSAGIGGGPNENCGDIVIEGGRITATARIFGNASHGTATGNAAGIGSGGGRTGAIRANTGTITICGDANVTAISEGRGAGIGGGGSNESTAGSNGTINIYDNAIVTASGAGNGAGIGGGGSVSGSAGGGGVIVISGNPTITASSIGPGAKEGGGIGSKGTITITGGNVYTAQASEVTNGFGDVLEMIPLVEDARPPYTMLRYTVQSSSGVYYIYTATTNAANEAYLWMPRGSVFRSLTLEAYDNATNEPIRKSSELSEAITYTSELRLLNENYNYFKDIIVLSDLVEASNPGEYSLILPSDIIFVVKEEENIVKIYYNQNRVEIDIIPIEARIDSQTGPLILRYAIPAARNENMTLEERHMPNLSYLGFRQDDLTKSKVSATQGVADDSIIFVYIDERPPTSSPSGGNGGSVSAANLTILCVDENGEAIYVQPLASLVVGRLETINAPALQGYSLSEDESTKREITIASGNNEVIFRYTKLVKIDEPKMLTAQLLILCVDEAGERIYVQPITSLVAGALESINAPELQGYSLAEGETPNREITITSGNNEVIFRYTKLEKVDEPQPPPAQLIISCVDETGEKICVQPITSLVVGNLETIKAPELQEYSLAEDETPVQTLVVESGNNEVIFKYDKPALTEESNKTPWIFILVVLICSVCIMVFVGFRRRKRGA